LVCRKNVFRGRATIDEFANGATLGSQKTNKSDIFFGSEEGMIAILERDRWPSGSITTLYAQSSEGDAGARSQLMERLSPIVHTYCRNRFGRSAFVAKSSGDFANEAMFSFHDFLAKTDLDAEWTRHDLVAFVFWLARKKQIQHYRSENAEKRGAGKVLHASALSAEEIEQYHQATKGVRDSSFDVYCKELLDVLPPDLCFIAISRFQGFTLRDIAAELECHISTVKRKTSLIRAKWKEILH